MNVSWMLFSLIFAAGTPCRLSDVHHLFAVDFSVVNTSDIVILVLQVGAAVVFSYFAYYILGRIRQGKYDEGASLQEMLRQFREARDEGELSEEEYQWVCKELSEKIIAEVDREKQEKSRQIKTQFSPNDKRLKR